MKEINIQNTSSQENKTNFAQLKIWTKKFAEPLLRVLNTSLQKITASEHGYLILSVYKPGDDKSTVLLSMKKGESGISTTHLKPIPLKKPNSIVQITRKYLQGRRVVSSYATISPITVVLEFGEANSKAENFEELQNGPNCLILDLDHKPPRIILAKKFAKIPERYVEELGHNFNHSQEFFESWCEWSENNTKTKKRACFTLPFISYCPLLLNETVTENTNKLVQPNIVPNIEKNIHLIKLHQATHTLTGALEILPTHIRRSARTRLQFLARRIAKQKADLPDALEISRLQKQSEGLKTNLYLWPKSSLIWYVPPQFIEEYNMPPFYSLKKFEKPGDLLSKIHKEIDALKRRRQELTTRIAESIKAEEDFQQLISESSNELKNLIQKYTAHNTFNSQEHQKMAKYTVDYILEKEDLPKLSSLCRMLDISLREDDAKHKAKNNPEMRLPFREYLSTTGERIRVSKTAEDGDKMIKMMPSNHTWLHVLTGEGSHVWLEKLKGSKTPSQQAIREAAILAIHHSKHSKAQSAEIQIATRADIEKRKNLAPGKVLVRRCETILIKYENNELQKLTTNSN